MSLVFRCASCGGLNRVAADRLASGPKCGRCKAAIDLAAHPQELDDLQLSALVESSPVPVLVDFWAPWCGPCRMVAPQVAQVAARHAGRLVVVKVNTDHHQRHMQELHIQGIPFLAVWKGREVVYAQAGAQMAAQIDAAVTPHLD